MNPCKSEPCSLCQEQPSTSFCPCQASPLVLCDACVPGHIAGNRLDIHEIVPIEALGYWTLPEYERNVRERRQKCKEARKLAEDTEKGIESWGKKTCEIMNNMIDRLIETREKIKSELSELKAELLHTIETGLQEALESIYVPQPALKNPLAKALFASSAGEVRICALQTDFEDWMQSFERFLFSIDIRLQLKLPDFQPKGLITTIATIRPDRKVNLYLPFPSPTYTRESKEAKENCGPYPLEADTTPLIYRGPVSDEAGNTYIGQWNPDRQNHGLGQHFQPDGAFYEGQFRLHEFSGKGRFVSSEGTVWDCEWKNHDSDRFGVKQSRNGEKYIGEMKKDQQHGIGFLHFSETDPSEAVFYFGQQEDGQLHGWGAIMYRNGYMYFGQFKEGKAHGKGLCHGSDESLYYGDFAEGCMEGQGMWLLSDGRVYTGEMRGNEIGGRGKMRERGREYEGKWQDGVLRRSEDKAERKPSKRRVRKLHDQ